MKSWQPVVFSANTVRLKIWRAEVSLISIAKVIKWTNVKGKNIASSWQGSI